MNDGELSPGGAQRDAWADPLKRSWPLRFSAIIVTWPRSTSNRHNARWGQDHIHACLRYALHAGSPAHLHLLLLCTHGTSLMPLTHVPEQRMTLVSIHANI